MSGGDEDRASLARRLLPYFIGVQALSGVGALGAGAGLVGYNKLFSDLDRLKRTSAQGAVDVGGVASILRARVDKAPPVIFSPGHARGGFGGFDDSGPQYLLTPELAEKGLDAYNTSMARSSRQRILGVPALAFVEAREFKDTLARRMKGAKGVRGMYDAFNKARADFDNPMSKLHHFNQFRRGDVTVDGLRGHQVAQILNRHGRKLPGEAYKHLTGDSKLGVMARLAEVEADPAKFGMDAKSVPVLSRIIKERFLGTPLNDGVVMDKMRGAVGWNDKVQGLTGRRDFEKDMKGRLSSLLSRVGKDRRVVEVKGKVGAVQNRARGIVGAMRAKARMAKR
jgi:hypothetical protein